MLNFILLHIVECPIFRLNLESEQPCIAQLLKVIILENWNGRTKHAQSDGKTLCFHDFATDSKPIMDIYFNFKIVRFYLWDNANIAFSIPQPRTQK